MQYLSPLDLIFKKVSAQCGKQDSRLEPGQREFAFGDEFPKDAMPLLTPVDYRVTVSWDDEKRKLYITTGMETPRLGACSADMQHFFELLSSTVSLFTEEWPGGMLTPLMRVEDEGVVLGHHATVSCPPGYDPDGLHRAFDKVNACATQALLFTRPLVGSIAKREMPSVDDIVRTCHLEFDKYQAYLAYHEKPPPRAPRWGAPQAATPRYLN